MKKYILFFVSFFIPFVCIAEPIDDIARDVGIIKNRVGADGILGDIKDALTLENRGLLGDIKVLINDNKNVLSSIRSNIGIRGEEEEDSFIGSVLYYLREIYNFLHNPLEGSDFSPEYRYVEFQKITDELEQTRQDMMTSINNLILAENGGEPEEPVKPTYVDNTGVEYSSFSANSFFGTDIYESQAQQSAAKGFIMNTVGSLSFPLSDASSDEYKEYRNTISSIQSFAASNLVDSYIDRFPVEVDIAVRRNGKFQEQTVTNSKLNLLKEMNVYDPSQVDYWDKEDSPGNLGIAQRALMFFNSFFALNYSLIHIYEQLNRVNIQLALMITQNSILGKHTFGNALYEQSEEQITYDDLEGMLKELLKE